MKNPTAIIHQFHYSASHADAVTNHMRLIRSALQEVGIGGEIFVGRSRAPKEFGLLPFEANAVRGADVLLIHHSHGNPLLADVLELPVPKALLYHNVTPEHFFPHDVEQERFSQLGRQQLSELLLAVSKAYGVSTYNCNELRLAGFKQPVLFPLLDLHRPGVAAEAPPRQGSGPRRLLFVGKLTPHKNQALLVKTLFYLDKIAKGQYELVLVGRQDPLYGRYVRLLAQALGVADQVHLTGPLSDSLLANAYSEASAFVCPSLHEGFCVPLVEAMQRGLPIFAVPAAGVRETLGTAGIRLVSREPHHIAESIDVVLSDSAAVSTVCEGQRQRFEELSEVQTRSRIQSLCLEMIESFRMPQAHPVEVYT